MKFKISLLILPLLLLTCTLFAKPVFDSIGVENQHGKKIIIHKVEPKDTYYAIGRRYNVKPNLIIQYNNNLPLHPGLIIKVPTEIPFATERTNQPVQQTTKTENDTPAQQYKVSAHETLYAIAKRFNTTVDDIKRQNNLHSDVLIPGQLLTVKAGGGVVKPAEEKEQVTEAKPIAPPPAVRQPTVQTQPNPQTPVSMQNTQQYKVSNGETLSTIAKRFNTTIEDIIALNKLPNNNIRPGQILIVRSGPPPAPVAKPDTSMVSQDSLNLDRHLPPNRFGLFEKVEKGPATWMDDPSFDPNKKLVLHKTAPIGTVMKITNPMTNRTTFAKVVGRFADNESTRDVILVVTKNVAESLGALDKRFRVTISYGVPNEQQAQ